MVTLVKEIPINEVEVFPSKNYIPGGPKKKQGIMQTSEPLKCEICSKLFISTSFLMCHKKIYHRGSKDNEELSGEETDELFEISSSNKLLFNAKELNGENMSETDDESQLYNYTSSEDDNSKDSISHLEKRTKPQPWENSNENQVIQHVNTLCEPGEMDEETDNILDEQPVTDVEMHKCELCKRLFISEECLKHHRRQHGNSESSQEHRCSHCGFNTSIFSEFLSHLSVHQDNQVDERPFKCLECGKGFKTDVHHRQHQQTHAKIQPLICSICGSMFRKDSSLANHMKSHETRIPTVHSGKNVKLNKQELVVRRINNAGDKRYHCSICDKGFACTNNLMKHYIAVHDPDNPNIPTTSSAVEKQKHEDKSNFSVSADAYPCDKCGRLFTSVKMLEGHKKIHRNETENRRFRCPHCKYSTNRATDLRNHVAIHTNERPYQCSYCGKGFTERSSLRNHTFIHTGEKPYVCEVCGKRFTQRAHINIHMRIHNKEKPYRCPYCEKTFAYHNVLTRHQRTHTGERPYKCSHCDESFKSSGALRSHEIARHTHEYPLECTECGKGFIQFGSMQVHLRNVHNIAIYKLKENQN
ncbi:zinc finger protein 2-like [Limulus polyphemus]|uniref:Zinc finger protein 2-like n=1 Tax=Limulus polyphemus TaxID=6850 RepID=A0ABM1SIM6_LIMPO|nr:zinc finger protein 2-like [Limulus polyphemus]